MKLKFGKNLKNVNMKKLFRRNQIIVTTLAVMVAAAGYLNYAQKEELKKENGAYEAGVTDVSQEDILAENQNYLNLQGDYQEIQSLDQDWDQIEEAQSQAGADQVSGQPEGAVASQIQQIEGQTQLAQAGAGGNGQTGDNSNGQAGDSSYGQDGAELTAADGQTMSASDGQTGTNDGQGTGESAGFENPGEAILTSGMSVSDYIAGVQLSREQVRAKNKETLLNIINNTNIEESAKQEAIQNMIQLTEIAEKENAAETLLQAKGFADPVVSISSDKVDVVINAPSLTDPQRAQIEDVVKRKTDMGAESIIITLLNCE